MSYRLDQRSKMLLIVIGVLTALVLGLHLARGQMVASATSRVAQAGDQIKGAQNALAASEQQIDAAKKVHLKMYTKDLSTAKQREVLARAKANLEAAEKASNPDNKRKLATRATSELGQVQGGLKNYQDYIQMLDKARENYRPEPERLLTAINETDKYIKGLVTEGYFDKHFDQPRKGLSEARGERTKAIELSKKMVEGEYPDYLQVYQTCLNGEQVAASAKQLAESVPGSRKSNEANIGRLNTGVTNLKMRYNDALVAGVSLEPYAPYRILDQVELANKQLDSALTQIRSAQDQNSMRVQQFLGAAELLGTVDRQLSATDLLFNNAVQKWETVSAAKAQIPGAKASASTAIASAISHKNSYSENSQSTAESYISQAQSAMRSGNSYATVDPPKGLSYYHQAKNYADQAYSAVDTSDNDYHSSSSSSDWSGSSGGGSTSTWGGSTGSGSSSSNWGGSSGGGNYGGPSGGGYGGPSGGGMGRGGF